MKLLLSLIGILISLTAFAQDYSGYTALSLENRKHFVPFSIDSVDKSTSYDTKQFTIQEIDAGNLKQIAEKSKYTWVVIWAPWCEGTKEIAENYLKFEKNLKDKDVRLIFVAIAYGPDGISKVLNELGYNRYSYVIQNVPNKDGAKLFRKELNKKFKYRNANHYIFKRESGLLYTGNDHPMSLSQLQSIIK